VKEKNMRIPKLTGLIIMGTVLFAFVAPARATVPGCADNVSIGYSTGFDASQLDLSNTDIDENDYIVLRTGFEAINPNSIVIPVEQEVSVTFLYEGAGYRLTDFGWLYAQDGETGEKHFVYYDVNDNNADGVLDKTPDNTDPLYEDINGDGSINALDNRQVLGTFSGGTELVFFLKVDNENKTFFTKEAWNPDNYTSTRGECDQNNFTKIYHLGLPLIAEGSCTLDSNWMAAPAYNRLRDLFDLEFAEDDVTELDIKRNKPFAHVIVGAPGNKPNEWVLGWEDLGGGGDTDHNDLIFQIEREAAGSAQLLPAEAIESGAADTYFTGITIEIYDEMPNFGDCEGKTSITYELLHYYDDTPNTVPDIGDFEPLDITDWNEVFEFSIDGQGDKVPGDAVPNWTPGNPERTYRTARVDLAGLGLAPNRLLWRATLTSQEEGCEPRVIDMSFDASVATHGIFSRSSPVVLANVIYSSSYETPEPTWDDKELRGHLTATRLYAPDDPDTNAAQLIWNAGEKLTNRNPDTRDIKFPKITEIAITDEKCLKIDGITELVGDGTTKAFTGKLSNAPLLATTIEITDSVETFDDQHTDVLEGRLGGTGTINRFTGDFTVTFLDAPHPGQSITAKYTYYTTQQQLLQFNTTNVKNALLAVDKTKILPGGYIYDFNGDDDITEADGNWLVNWVRGYKDGASQKKEWLLGPIDHSVPAGASPPGRPAWLFGTAITAAERNSYEAFQQSKQDRDTVVYVGARDGMLHAFDAGKFLHGDNLETSSVKELRGYFEWEDLEPPSAKICPDYCSSDCSKCPNYGSGEELWAFIPNNLIPRLKNNLRKADDQAYVDASPALVDVFINNQWKTVLLSAQGNGGDTVFCLDVTDPYNPNFLWEFADPDLFRSRSSPSVAKVGRIVNGGTPMWVAFFVSGKTTGPTPYPSIYMINIANGHLVDRIFLDQEVNVNNNNDIGRGGVPTGQPTIIDSDGNGYIDRIYIGSDTGLLYKVIMPDDPNANQFAMGHCVINNDFIDDDNNEVDSDQRFHPIYGSPVAIVNNGLTGQGNIAYDIRIFFGTGDSPYFDEDIDTNNTTYHFFAYRDKNDKGVCDPNSVTLDWFHALDAGERIFATAFAAAGNIYFGTSTAETEDPCQGGGGNQGGIGGGSVYTFSYDGDGSIPKLEVGNVSTTPLVVDEHLYVKSEADGLRSYGGGPYNNPTNMGQTPEFKLRYWRELF